MRWFIKNKRHVIMIYCQHIVDSKPKFSSPCSRIKSNYQFINLNSIFSSKTGLRRTMKSSQTASNYLKLFLDYIIDLIAKTTHVFFFHNLFLFGWYFHSKFDFFQLLCIFLSVRCITQAQWHSWIIGETNHLSWISRRN